VVDLAYGFVDLDSTGLSGNGLPPPSIGSLPARKRSFLNRG
jgi:hypothetical protein